ncbi:MAG: CcmD family protein [Bacteroidetes bacterium]|nr:MAG: CcmD family protein [Bacteroidota bacterium]
MKNKLTLLLTLFGISLSAFAQDDVEMADVMRSNGKIYVVVAVMTIVFVGLFIYLITLNKKVEQLEKQINKE